MTRNFGFCCSAATALAALMPTKKSSNRARIRFRKERVCQLGCICVPTSILCGWCSGGRSHFQSPDGHWTHVHPSPEVSGDIPRFGRTEPVAFAFVNYMIKSPGGLPRFRFHALTYQQSGVTEGGAHPHLFGFGIGENGAIFAHAIRGAHLAVAEFHHVKVED